MHAASIPAVKGFRHSFQTFYNESMFLLLSRMSVSFLKSKLMIWKLQLVITFISMWKGERPNINLKLGVSFVD